MWRVVVHFEQQPAWIVFSSPQNVSTAWFWKEQTFQTPLHCEMDASTVTSVSDQKSTLWVGRAIAENLDNSQNTAGLVISPGGLPGASFLIGALPALFEHVPGPFVAFTGNSVGAIATFFLAQQPPGKEADAAVKMANALAKMPSIADPAPPVQTGKTAATVAFLNKLMPKQFELYGRDVSWGSVAVSKMGTVSNPMDAYHVFRPALLPMHEITSSVVASCTICSLMYSPILYTQTTGFQEWIDGGYLDMLPLRNVNRLPARLYVIAMPPFTTGHFQIEKETLLKLWETSWARYWKQIEFLQQVAKVQITTITPSSTVFGTTLSQNMVQMIENALNGRLAVLNALL